MHDAATLAGHDTALPDLTSIVTSARPHGAYIDAAVQAAGSLRGPVHVVGHSGAGAFLPSIGAGMTNLGGLVFVDAVIPPAEGHHRTAAGLHTLLNSHTVDGRLEPWLDWWPTENVAELLPHAQDRSLLRADMPQLQRSFYDTDLAVPSEWSDRSCSFLQLSSAYAEELAEATMRRWATSTIASTHLGIHTESHQVLDAIMQLVTATA